jgi:endoglucanase
MILRELSEALGISGDEGKVRAIVRQAIQDHTDEFRIDAMGNVLATKRGTGASGLRVMVSAHMDEIGLMVVGHTSEGLLHVGSVGGVDARLLPGTVLQVGPQALPGIIGLRPVHLLSGLGDRTKAPKLDEILVDIGAKKKDEAEKLAPRGTLVGFKTAYRELGSVATGKAFDDRVGCAVLVSLLQSEPFAFDLHAAFTVQEEVGLRGATVAAHALQPDCAFALEGTVADDLPKEKEGSPTTEVGHGPAITVADRSFIADKRLVRHLIETAEALSIPYQIKQPGVGGTDSGAVFRSRGGVPAVTVSVPCRYIHSPASLMNLDDFHNSVQLMREALMRLSEQTLKRD